MSCSLLPSKNCELALLNTSYVSANSSTITSSSSSWLKFGFSSVGIKLNFLSINTPAIEDIIPFATKLGTYSSPIPAFLSTIWYGISLLASTDDPKVVNSFVAIGADWNLPPSMFSNNEVSSFL